MPRFLAVLFLCVSFAFAQSTSRSSISTLSTQGKIGARSSVTLAPMSAESAVDSTYILGPGDFLDLMLEDNYITVQIYPDGSIAVEECGGVVVGGMTLAQAREAIMKLVSKRYNPEFCFVQLSVLKKFRVNAMGAVSQVGQHVVEPQTRLSFFIRQVGGTVSSAKTDDVQVIRGKDTLHVNYSQMANKGNFDDDVVLQQGDKVFVPFVEMGDNVVLLFPGYRTSVGYKEGNTLQDYFDLANGGRLQNYGYKALCVREPGKEPRWITPSEMKENVVAPNTEVEFTVQPMRVYVAGTVGRIGEFQYEPSWHAIDYVGAAGLTPMSGSWDQVKVWRGNAPEALSLNVTQDQILPGDVIELPKSRYETFKDFTLFLASLLTVISSAIIVYANYK